MRQLIAIAQLVSFVDEAFELGLCISVALASLAGVHEIAELLAELPEYSVLKGLQFTKRKHLLTFLLVVRNKIQDRTFLF